MTVYHRVVFNRGTGLGNRLFPWSRCVVSSAESGQAMLAPHWISRLRRGSFALALRTPRAFLRQAMLIGVFQPRPSEIRGRERRRAERQPELLETHHDDGPRFAVLDGKRELLLEAFRQATRPRWVALADRAPQAVIGIHIRRGDFNIAQRSSDFIMKGTVRTPLDWYVRTLRIARNAAGANLPAVVTSDGSASELAALLHEPDVTLLRTGCPATDLLVLSSTKLLLGSGGSSFSAWAAYFGAVPVVTIPGQSLAWFELQRAAPFVGTFDPDEPDEDFLYLCRSL